MGATDVERQAPNVMRMRLLGAYINPVTSGAGTLKDAMNEALRDWVTNVSDTYYIIGTAAGPHPYPELVRNFQSVIGNEAREQMLEAEGRLPDTIVACIGGGSNAIGLFHPFLDDENVSIIGVEAGGYGLDVENGHASSMSGGSPGVLHGNRTYPAPGRRRPDPRRPLDLRRPRLPRRWPRARLAEGHRPRRPTFPPPTRKPSTRCNCAPASKASSRPSNRPMPWPTSSRSRQTFPRTTCSS